MTLYALIPAKATSERLPGKNLRLLGGRTLLQRAIDVARSSELFGDHIYVSSEDGDTLRAAEQEGVRTLKRPPELSQPGAVLANVLEHAARQLEWRGAIYVVTPTSPFRNPATMREAWAVYQRDRPGALLSITPYEHPPYWALLWNESTRRLDPMDEQCLTIPREYLPVAYKHDGSHFITRENPLGVQGFPVAWEEAVDVNTERDLAFAEHLLSSGRVPWARAAVRAH